MEVLVVADAPVREAIVAGLADADVTVGDGPADGVEEARFAVVAGLVGSAELKTASEAAVAGGTPWLAVELGGIGGQAAANVDAAVTGFAPGAGCLACLETRVEAAGHLEPADAVTVDRSSARFAGAVAAHEAVGLFAGDDPSIVGHVVELPYTRRRLLPVPGCACGESRDRSLDRDADSRALEATVEACEQVIDARVGIVTQIGEVSSFPAPYYLATLAGTEPLSDVAGPTEAAGVDADWNAALVKAVGEGLERYCAAVYRDADLEVDPDGERVDPGAFVRPENDTDQTDLAWVQGEHLATGEPVWLPASEVHFPPPRPRVRPAITTGLGLGSSTVDALRSGLTEVIERDAAMLAWYSSFEPVGLTVEDETFETLSRRAASEGLAVSALGITQDVDVPVVAVAVHRDPDAEGDWPHFAAGSAAALDGERAAAGALSEALQNWMELRELGPERAAAEAGGWIAEYGEDPGAAREFVDVEPRVDAGALGPDPTPTGVAALEALVDAISTVGLEASAVSLTTPDVASVGFEAVRVVIPGAQPLFTRAAFFGERAREVPRSLGYEPRLERDPHPFP